MKRINNYHEFQESLQNNRPNPEWTDGLIALWHDAKGDWEASHDIAQEMQSELGSLIHAYLHRKEGDEFNARYWYRRANRPFPIIGLEEEFREMVEALIIK